MADFSKLPIELINIIINYTDIVVYRDGKYLNRISKYDERYNMIKKRLSPIWFGIHKYIFYFRFYDTSNKKSIAMEHTYNPINDRHYLSKREIIKYDDSSIITETKTNYIFDLGGKCHKIVNYVM